MYDWCLICLGVKSNAAGVAGALAAGIAAGASATGIKGPELGPDGRPLDPRHRHDKDPQGNYKYPAIPAGDFVKFSKALQEAAQAIVGSSRAHETPEGEMGTGNTSVKA